MLDRVHRDGRLMLEWVESVMGAGWARVLTGD
jgi:hypothetical protein